MKHAKLFALALTFMPLLATAQFNGRPRIITEVPFEFRVGNKLFPAGQCIIEPAPHDSNVLVVRDMASKTIVLAPAGSNVMAAEADHFALVFHKYDNTYFLSGIKVDGLRQMYRLPESRKEAEIRARNTPVTDQILLASE
ncbi:MAG TPA: hypothetical protein VMG82_40615 [Candidatus Sulfotelmatobacter sp.]|nr:hypothetical protein [Candidatus Sulfotelmatobacter sp.]